MTDFSAFAALFSGTSHAYQLAKALLGLKVSAEVAVKINELLGEIGELHGNIAQAHAAHAACESRRRDLEEENARLRAFDDERGRYQLCEWSPGTFVFCLRPGHEHGEPLHRLCPNCYQQAVKRILQFARHDGRFDVHGCSFCKAEYRVLTDRVDRAEVAPVASPWRDFP